MSKYIDAETLIAEIERLKKHSQEAKMEFMEEGYSLNAFAEDCRLKSFDKLLSFIDSLQPEQPEVDLEKEIDVCWKNWLSPSNQKDVEGVLPKTEFAMYARHFFELGRNASKAIWHNVAEEVPTEVGAEVVVACKNKNKEDGIWLYDLIQCWEGEWKPRVNWEKPIRWAYVRDLDNARKKE